MNKTQNILSTGKKVNSAIDNASSYYQARALTNRAGDLSALLDSMGQGIQTIQAATEGLTSATTFLEQATAVANQALEKGENVIARVSNETELLAAVDSGKKGLIVIENDITLTNELKLKDGQGLVGTNYSDGDGGKATISFTTDKEGVMISGNDIFLSDLNLKATSTGPDTYYGYTIRAVYLENGQLNNVDINTEGYVTIGAQGNIKFTGTNNINTIGRYGYGLNSSMSNMKVDGILNIVTEGNGALAVNLPNLEVNGKLNIDTKNYHSFYNAKITMGENGQIMTGEGIFTAPQGKNFNTGKNISDLSTIGFTKIGDFDASLFDEVDKNNTHAVNRAEEEQFATILKEFDNLINDSSYQGINLLNNGKLDITFNESRSNKFSVQGRDMKSQSLGIESKTWNTKSGVEKALKELTSAVDKIRDFQSELGNNYSIIQTRQNFTEALTDVLETGADNLVLADMNEASAEYLMLQTRQQLATNSLSLAAQSVQSILSLF